MLIEWLHYLTTPASWRHRRLGYVRDSVSLLSRSRRCRAAWADHLAAARALVLESCATLDRRRTVVVLGSGLLDDVPLGTLAGMFRTVVLVDAVHLWPARAKVLRHRNVRMLTADLSGVAAWLHDPSAERTDPLPAICDGPEVDLVISANLLSQLPILPLDRIGDHGLDAPPGLGRAIVTAHLDGLARLRARVCLVTDTEQITEDRQGTVVDRFDLLHGVILPAPDRAWTWHLAPFGETARHEAVRHRVQGYADWASAWTARPDLSANALQAKAP